jgi:hypothetical protein
MLALLTGRATIGKMIHHRATEKNTYYWTAFGYVRRWLNGPQPRSDCCGLSSVTSVALS